MTAGGPRGGWSPCLSRPQTSSLSRSLPAGGAATWKGRKENGKIRKRNVLRS